MEGEHAGRGGNRKEPRALEELRESHGSWNLETWREGRI